MLSSLYLCFAIIIKPFATFYLSCIYVWLRMLMYQYVTFLLRMLADTLSKSRERELRRALFSLKQMFQVCHLSLFFHFFSGCIIISLWVRELLVVWIK